MTDLKPMQENMSGFPEIPASEHWALRRAYWASLEYSDVQIAKVLKALTSAGQLDNTIVAVVGDHVSLTFARVRCVRCVCAYACVRVCGGKRGGAYNLHTPTDLTRAHRVRGTD